MIEIILRRFITGVMVTYKVDGEDAIGLLRGEADTGVVHHTATELPG